jgi:hypothetical protein
MQEYHNRNYVALTCSSLAPLCPLCSACVTSGQQCSSRQSRAVLQFNKSTAVSAATPCSSIQQVSQHSTHQLVQKTEGSAHQECIQTGRGALHPALPELPAHQQAVRALRKTAAESHLTFVRNTVWLCSHGDGSHGSAQSAGNKRAGGYVKHAL